VFLYKHFLGGTELSQLDDIIRNLSNVLHTKRGTGYFLQNFGLTEGGFRTPQEAIMTLKSELEENIRLYEPRVEFIDADEEYDDDGKRARLVVKLRMREAQEKLQIVIDLQKNSIEILPVKKKPAR